MARKGASSAARVPKLSSVEEALGLCGAPRSLVRTGLRLIIADLQAEHEKTGTSRRISPGKALTDVS